MKTILFDSWDKFNDYIYNYMERYHTDAACVYIRFANRLEELKVTGYELQMCCLEGFDNILWLIDWWEGEKFIELQSIVTKEEIEELTKQKGGLA